LRADVEGYVNGRLSGLRDEIERLHSQFNEAFTRLSERLASESQSDASVAVAIAEHLRTARNAGIEAAASGSSRARASSDVAIIKAAIDELDNQRTQADILNALVNRTAGFAPRVAFFVLKNERATGWRARGLEGTVGDDSIREISLPLTADTLLSEVTRTRSTWSGAPGSHAEDREIFGKFGEEMPQRIIAIPLLARDKVVAVLYADSAAQDSDAINLEAIETMVRVAGMAVELLAIKRPQSAGAAAAQTQEAPRTEEAATHVEAQVEAPAPSVVSEPAVEAAWPAVEEESAVQATPEPAEEEPAPAPSYEAAPSYEPAPSFQEPPAPAARDEWTAGADSFSFGGEAASQPAATTPPPPAADSAPRAGRRYGQDSELPVQVRDEEKQFHAQARRFARLLVSEIKLYNESKVTEGRTHGDLYSRLREDIDRSRQMYDKRVAPEVAGRYDYFHHELVNTLAEGDEAKLGDGYPGATVAA
jgi:hypothetical protein